jgi:hypothetical protein
VGNHAGQARAPGARRILANAARYRQVQESMNLRGLMGFLDLNGSLRDEREKVKAEIGALAAERDAHLLQRDEALGERNEFLRQRDIALGERNELLRQRNAARRSSRRDPA